MSNKPRVFISTDLRLSSEEKDDAQSLIHALMYQDKMDIVGIAGTASRWGHQNGLVGDIDKIIDIYGQDVAKLQAHASGFKSVADLKAISWQGATAIAPSAGYSTPTASSKAIIAEAKKAAAVGEKLNVLTWGGETDIAQAVHDDPSIAPHIRFFNIYNQDPYAKSYLLKNFKGKFDMWVDDMSTMAGVMSNPTAKSLITGWHDTNAKGHGALGDFFAQISGDIFNKQGIKMGDSPTVFRFLSGNQDDPTQESWGGEFRKVSERYYTDKTETSVDFDWSPSTTKGAMTIYEDRAAWLSSFAERFDWIRGTTAPLPPKPTDLTLTGDDTVTITLGGSDYLGDPMAAFIFDGKEIGRATITADYEKGEAQTFTFKGAFDPDGLQMHRITVKLLNDKWDGNKLATTDSGHDRNLFIESVMVNGVTKEPNKLITSGSAGWDFQV
jgi:hypothetical protein